MNNRTVITFNINHIEQIVCKLDVTNIWTDSKAAGNRRLAQWRVTCLIEHSTSHQLLWCIDSFVLRNPPLRQAPKRYKAFLRNNNKQTMNFDPTFDYGFSDLKKKDNLVCWKFGELVKTLVTLSSSADRQIEIMGAGIVTDEMAEDFNTYFTLSYKEFVDNKLMNETTTNKLKYLDNFLDERSGDKDPDFWDDTTLSINNDWQNVRTQAKEILTLMGFENLDIDFERTEKHEKSNEGQKLLIQTTRTRLIRKP